MFNSGDLRAILVSIIANILVLAVVAGYNWVMKPIQKRKLEQDEASLHFSAQLLKLMLEDSSIAPIVYAKAQREQSVSHFFFVLAFCSYILSPLFSVLFFPDFTYAVLASAPSLIASIALAWIGQHHGKNASVYELIVKAYEKRKEIPSLPANFW